MEQVLNTEFLPEPIMDDEARIRNWARNFLTNLHGYRQPSNILEYQTDLDSIILLMHAAQK